MLDMFKDNILLIRIQRKKFREVRSVDFAG